MAPENIVMLAVLLAAYFVFGKKLGSEQIYRWLLIGLAAVFCVLALVEFMRA